MWNFDLSNATIVLIIPTFNYFTDNIQPICVPIQADIDQGVKMEVAGWGVSNLETGGILLVLFLSLNQAVFNIINQLKAQHPICK